MEYQKAIRQLVEESIESINHRNAAKKLEEDGITLGLFNNGNGILFYDHSISYFDSCENFMVNFDDIQETIYHNDNGTNAKLTIKNTYGQEFHIRSDIFNLLKLQEYIDKALELRGKDPVGKRDGESFIILEDMPNVIKVNYLRIIINMTCLDSVINQKKLAEIYSLISQLKFSPESRAEIREYISDPNIKTIGLLEEMDASVPGGSSDVLHLSLIKDCIRVARSDSKDIGIKEKEFIDEIAQTYGISQEQIEVLELACINDEKIIEGKISDSEIVKNAKELAAKAGAVGVPVAAVYLSGSVVGLSAAGITSGLAALGLGGILGLSSMVTGIGVAIIAGVGVYKSIKWITGGSEREKASKREFLIQQAIRNNQETINNLIEDINYYSEKIVGLLRMSERNELLIEKLSKELSIFSKALSSLRQKGLKLEGIVEDEK